MRYGWKSPDDRRGCRRWAIAICLRAGRERRGETPLRAGSGGERPRGARSAQEARGGPGAPRRAMSAIFNFEALLLVLLLSICTAAYLKDQPWIGPRMEANKHGCAPARPPARRARGPLTAGFARRVQDASFRFQSLWRLARIGERLSPYVSLGCIMFGVYVLLVR